WKGWPPVEYVKSKPFADVHIEMNRALNGHVKVDLAVQNGEEADKVKRLFRDRKVPHEHVRFHDVPHTDVWFRDMGPLFVKGGKGALKIVDFKFNLWGTADLTDKSARIDEEV